MSLEIVGGEGDGMVSTLVAVVAQGMTVALVALGAEGMVVALVALGAEGEATLMALGALGAEGVVVLTVPIAAKVDGLVGVDAAWPLASSSKGEGLVLAMVNGAVTAGAEEPWSIAAVVVVPPMLLLFNSSSSNFPSWCTPTIGSMLSRNKTIFL